MKAAVRSAEARLTPEHEGIKRARPARLVVDINEVVFVRVGPPGAYKSWAGLKSGKMLGVSNREAGILASRLAAKTAGVEISFSKNK